MTPANVYMFTHGAIMQLTLVHQVQWSDEALALQFRIAVPPAQMHALDRPPSQLDSGVAAVIADALLTRSWRLPTMTEVHGQL